MKNPYAEWYYSKELGGDVQVGSYEEIKAWDEGYRQVLEERRLEIMKRPIRDEHYSAIRVFDD